jgi:transposase
MKGFPMVAEVFAGASAFKAMFDLAKGLKDLNDAATRNAVAIELQEKILSAQVEQAMLIERIGHLEKKVAGFEKWEAEKQRYELKDLGWGSFAYMLKSDARGPEPPHWICAHCYEHGHKEIFQHVMKPESGRRWTCPACKNEINPRTSKIEWID